MVKEWCNNGSTWDNTLAAMNGRKKLSEKTNKDLIALMLGVGIDEPSPPEPTKTRLSKEAADECIAAVNASMVIPHPTADDQPKCIACKSAVALHMAIPTNLIKGKRYNLDYCNPCMLVAEAGGVIFIDNPASCGCPATRFRTCLDYKSCHTKKITKDRTGAMCNKGCGVDLGIGPFLLGTTKEWMILSKFTCSKCTAETCVRKKCAVEGCDKLPRMGCSGHCLAHATQEQRDVINDEQKKKRKKCAVEGCDKFSRMGCSGHCLDHATQEQRDAINDERKKTKKWCAVEGYDKLPRTGCSGHCLAHATQEQRDAINDKRKKKSKW
jgi:hypothetical protein